MSYPVPGAMYVYNGPSDQFLGYDHVVYLTTGEQYIITKVHSDHLVSIRQYGATRGWPFLVSWRYLDPRPTGPAFLEDQQ